MDLSQFKQMPTFFFQKPSENGGGSENDDEPEDGTGDDEIVDKAGKVEFSSEQQKAIGKLLSDARKAEREKARKDAETQAAREKADAEKKKLEEEGEFKKLKDEAEREAAQEKARAAAAEAELSRMKLQRQFETGVADAGLKFVSPKAAEDAFGHLDPEAVGDDGDGMSDEVKRLAKEYDYLFGEGVEAPEIDATDKGKVSKKPNRKDLVEKKKRTGRYNVV